MVAIILFYFGFQDENLRALVFYLEHARNLNLEFPVYLNKYEGTRMLRYV